MNPQQPQAKDRLTPIPWASPVLWGNEKDLVLEAMESTWISGGPFIERFEGQIREYCGVPYAAAVSNGTTAIHLAYLALGLKPGDEVIVPGFGFLAAANIALHMGVKPVFCEVDSETWCARAEDIEKCITPRTKAAVPVHTYGNVCEMSDIMALGKARNITIIEDAAESFASQYDGRQSGSIGDLGTFSFQATKTITTGEGGMVLTRDAKLYESMCLYRSHGMLKRRYWHEVPGHNFRLTNFQAALGCAQFEKLPNIERQRRRVHERYNEHLGSVPGVVLQTFRPNVDPVLWAMAFRIDPAAFPQGRDTAMAQLKDKGIETRQGFYTPCELPIYRCAPLPICQAISSSVISLPTFPTLGDDQIEYICQRVKELRR